MSFYSNVNTDVRAQTLDLSAVMRQVYLWMTLGLAVSAGIAFYVASSGLAIQFYQNPILVLVTFLGYFVLAMAMRPIIMNAPVSIGALAFLALSAVLGVMLSSVFLAGASVVSAPTGRGIARVVFDPTQLRIVGFAFIATAGTFGAMSVIGYTTKVDLSRFGGALLIALIGLIIASFVNILFASSFLFWIVNYAGVLIFAGLTAYSTQAIKTMAAAVSQGAIGRNGEAVMDGAMQRVALLGAFQLYLTFINLFLFMLSIFGGRRR
ncbi:MAG TPA: Bax inhibitor-1/YccA family protein [Aggregatilineales bacterium]|nr:Bax inhibitor-1/YccA family protein [Aggregatilineales bacterium]